MEFLLWFFRDFLDGPLYIILVIFSIILICAGIGYFAEKELNRKKEREKMRSNYTHVSNPNTNLDSNVSNSLNFPNYPQNMGNISNNQMGQDSLNLENKNMSQNNINNN